MIAIGPSRRPGPRSERGLALIGVVGLLLVFLVFAGALLTQLANEINSVKSSGVSNEALSAADAGVHAMVEQIQTDLANNVPPAGPVDYTYPEPGASPLTTSYHATIDPPISANGLNYYLITSRGTYSNGFELAKRTVRAIARAVPISDFASFSNYESNQFGNPVWYLSSQHFNGPVYSGGPMRIAYATPAPSPGPTVEPIFGAQVETLNNPVWAAPGDPNMTGDWSSVMALGAGAFSIDNTPLSLPQPSDDVYVASEAWAGDGSAFPTGSSYPTPGPGGVNGPGVYIDGSTSAGKDAATTTVPTDTTGIFINLGTTPNTASVISTVSGNTDTLTINSAAWGDTPYTVTINYSGFNTTGDCSGSTTVTHAGNTHTFSGTPCGAPGPGVTNTGNGAIFADGNLQLGCTASKLVCGTTPTANTTLEGDFSFVTPDYSGWNPPKVQNNDISIMGDLLYDTLSSPFDKTALWGNDVVLKTTATTGTVIDAAIIAGYPGEPSNDGDFNNVRCTRTGCGSSDQGVLLINGSLVENIRGAVGEVIAGNQFGFARVINFDSRFATAPPPFNPTTGALQIVAYEDMGT